MIEKINAFMVAHKEDLWVFLVIVLVAFLSFGLGRMSALYGENKGVEIIYPEAQAAGAVLGESVKVGDAAPATAGAEEYVASKNGSTYYFPWCGAASRIKSENLIRFKSREEAVAAGYRPAANCKGL